MGASAQTSKEILRAIEQVNDTWQAQHSPNVRAFWDNAAYFTGNQEAYRLTGKAQYYLYADRWAMHNNWQGATSTNPQEWKYKNYGEGQDYVLFGDWQICFQTYIDLNNLEPMPWKVKRATEVMTRLAHMPETDLWWWADALYMVMPLMTKMYLLTSDVAFLDKLTDCFLWSDSLMWDPDAQLYYRDAKYIYPKVVTATGGKSFWARGDGWVLAGLAKVLADMPKDYARRAIFEERFRQLAEGVSRAQQEGGYWSRSMLCEADAPGPETSGTAFFAYGLMWGVRNGYLDRQTYQPTIEKAWTYLYGQAMQPDHTIGYVQPIGEKPDPTRIVDATSQAPFGTGAWLLAACERVRYIDQPEGSPVSYSPSLLVTVTNPTEVNRQDVVQLSADTVFQRLGIGGGRQIVITDQTGEEVPYQLTADACILLQPFLRPRAEATFTIAIGNPSDYILRATGREYPNRMDDLTFENDRCAWRLYGAQMQGQGIAGFDVFCKNTQQPVVDNLYHNEFTSYALNERLKSQGRGSEWATHHRQLTYHRNHGQGMDAYTVGRTLGAGAPGIWRGGSIVLPTACQQAQITECGPLRFQAQQTMFESEGTTEQRTLTLDVGTHLMRVDVSPADQQLCAGIALHDSNPEVTINQKEGYIAYAENLDTPEAQNGQLYLGLVVAENQKAKAKQAQGHALLFSQSPSLPFSYYTASAWSRADVQTFAEWKALLADYKTCIDKPVIVDYR